MGESRWTYWQRTLRGMEKEFEGTALKAPSEIDGRALMWTYESLDEDHELEQFFAGLPGFCSSKVVDNPQSSLDSLRSLTVARDLNGFLERTWSSNLVSETIKIRRLLICIRAVDAAHLWDAAYEIFEFFEYRPALFWSIELGHFLINWGNNDDQETTWFARGIVASIITTVLQYNDLNDRWFSLTAHHLDISEHVLRGYLDHGDSVLLANLISFTRRFVRKPLKVNLEKFPLSHIFRRLGSNYNVQNTLPGLQHDFCSLWNEIVIQTRDRDDHLLFYILGKIHPIYVAFHHGSTPYGHYQLCSIPSHRIDFASNLNEVGDGRTAETTPAPITTSPALHHRDAVPSLVPPITEYDVPPPTSNLDHAIPHLVDERSRNGTLDNTTRVASSFPVARLENDRISDGSASNPIQLEGTTDPSAISSMVNSGSRPASVHGTASRPTGDMKTTASFVPDTVPSPIPLTTDL